MKSDTTKRAIEASLHKLLQEKSLDEITVKDLVEDCGISRQTFYYHFQDIYAVIEWRFQQVTQELMDQVEGHDWKKGIEMLLEMMQKDKVLLLNAYRAFDRSYLDRYLTRWTKPLLGRIINEQAQKYRIDAEALDFIVDIYVFGLVNVLLNWLDRGMASGMLDRLDYFYILLDKGLDDALRNFSH